jgi:hypothetical protein
MVSHLLKKENLRAVNNNRLNKSRCHIIAIVHWMIFIRMPDYFCTLYVTKS